MSYKRCTNAEEYGYIEFDEFDTKAGYKGAKREPDFSQITCGISEVQNFLKDPPLQKYNIQPQLDPDTGKAVFESKLDISNIQHLQVLIFDKDQVTQRLLDIDSTPIVKRDLTLNKKLNENRGLTQVRHNTILIPEEVKGYHTEDFIEDIASSEVTVVDDMTKVNEVLKQIQKLDKFNTDNYKKFYDFVGDWSNGILDTEKKNSFYSEYMSHELNLFLRKRDP